MTKVKLKAAFLAKPVERIRAPSEDDEDEEGGEPEYAQRLPFVRADAKRKRGPRGGLGRPSREPAGLHSEGYSNSALETSSSRGSDDDDDDDDNDNMGNSTWHGGTRDGGDNKFLDSTSKDGPRRGSVRVKVKPSKFLDKPTDIHATTEGRSPIKKKPTELPHQMVNSKQQFHTRDYSYSGRQPNHMTEELKTALSVVRKIMKMDAAEPFNVPVDPVALGILDYFDIVKRPMDLGTICKNLEKGGKYRNSRDVYEDVQLVWTNCRIYNQKGDPILELLARVKKNFMKYWTAAGLYTEKSPATYKFQGKSHPMHFGVQSQRETREDGWNRKAGKFAIEAESPTNSYVKYSGGTEQGILESRPANLYPDEFTPIVHRQQDVASNLASDELDTYSLNREGPKIISVYRTHKKKKMEEQDNKHLVPAGPAKGYEQDAEHKSEVRGAVAVKQHLSDKSHRQKDIDYHMTPGKSRRVSGTGHHRPDCPCVVCTGVRRKLAREGKLPSAEFPTTTHSTQERILVRLKTEGSGDRPKSSWKEERSAFAQSISVPLKNVKVDDTDTASMDASSEDEDGGALAHRMGEAAMSEQTREISETKAGTEDEEFKRLAADDVDDKEDAMQNDEHLADMVDGENERQEGGARYYRASYEMPLRKVNPSVLQMGQRLFGSGSPWKHGCCLGRHPMKSFAESPVLSAVSALLSAKGT